MTEYRPLQMPTANRLRKQLVSPRDRRMGLRNRDSLRRRLGGRFPASGFPTGFIVTALRNRAGGG
jgi:hypothetical protein